MFLANFYDFGIFENAYTFQQFVCEQRLIFWNFRPTISSETDKYRDCDVNILVANTKFMNYWARIRPSRFALFQVHICVFGKVEFQKRSLTHTRFCRILICGHEINPLVVRFFGFISVFLTKWKSRNKFRANIPHDFRAKTQ